MASTALFDDHSPTGVHSLIGGQTPGRPSGDHSQADRRPQVAMPPKQCPVFDYRTGHPGTPVAADANLKCPKYNVNNGQKLDHWPALGEKGLHGGVKVHWDGKTKVFFH